MDETVKVAQNLDPAVGQRKGHFSSNSGVSDVQIPF